MTSSSIAGAALAVGLAPLGQKYTIRDFLVLADLLVEARLRQMQDRLGHTLRVSLSGTSGALRALSGIEPSIPCQVLASEPEGQGEGRTGRDDEG